MRNRCVYARQVNFVRSGLREQFGVCCGVSRSACPEFLGSFYTVYIFRLAARVARIKNQDKE